MVKFEGLLSKFTNVVKGWQFRWFVLDMNNMLLEYYLPEEKDGKCRGRQGMEGALILPSEEDNSTFSINFSSGEVYKVRAAEAKERQFWVDKLRACSNRTANSQQTFVRSVMSPSSPCGNFGWTPSPAEALNNVNDILMGLEYKQFEIAETIDDLAFTPRPEETPAPLKRSNDLLLLKATCIATGQCLESAFTLLQDLSTTTRGPVPAPSRIKNTGN